MKKLNLLSKTEMKLVLGGTEMPPDEETVCRECESNSDCTNGRTCHQVNKTCSDGVKTMTRCMLPAFE